MQQAIIGGKSDVSIWPKLESVTTKLTFFLMERLHKLY